MSSYLKNLPRHVRDEIIDLYFIARLELENLFRAFQGFVARSRIESLINENSALESANRRLKSDNKYLAKRSVSLGRALDGVNKRGADEALISGRTTFGDITRDTATTFDTVLFPTLGLTATVRGDELVIDDANPEEPVDVVLRWPARTGETAPITVGVYR